MPDAVSGKLTRWTGLFTRFLSVQLLAQGMSLVAGFIFVRVLDKPDYALYVLTTGAIAAVFSLSNSFIIEASAAIGGRAWQDMTHLARVVASARYVRRRIALAAVIPVLMFETWLFINNGAGVGTVIFLSAALLCGNLALSSEIWRVVLRIDRQVRELQIIDLVDGATRLLLAVLLFRFLSAIVAVSILIIAASGQFLLSRRFSAGRTGPSATPSPKITDEMFRVVSKHWPYELLGVFRGQIVILILAVFGRTTAVADIGALTRISFIYAIVWSALHGIVLPHYARCQEPRQLRKLYGTILAACAFLALLPVAASLAMPTEILSILGDRYAHLSYELFLVTLSVGIAFFANVTGTLNSIRAWIIPAWILIPADLLTLIAMFAVLGVSTLEATLWAAIITDVVFLALNVGATIWFSDGFRKVGNGLEPVSP